ncbi:hypothetical protein FH063_002670 [Azospirillum argentinense]|uniref:Uncharacterized protein n=1 Tax=Azospirillum argentinense TaxID=2970906 RepID=A0A5B0KM92_9PROT|nr:hypothetical protein FH063_002670 [Azospirillum argentinense]
MRAHAVCPLARPRGRKEKGARSPGDSRGIPRVSDAVVRVVRRRTGHGAVALALICPSFWQAACQHRHQGMRKGPERRISAVCAAPPPSTRDGNAGTGTRAFGSLRSKSGPKADNLCNASPPRY